VDGKGSFPLKETQMSLTDGGTVIKTPVKTG
jgi:hypothetical protein